MKSHAIIPAAKKAKYLAEYAAVPEKMQMAPLVALAKKKAL